VSVPEPTQIRLAVIVLVKCLIDIVGSLSFRKKIVWVFEFEDAIF